MFSTFHQSLRNVNSFLVQADFEHGQDTNSNPWSSLYWCRSEYCPCCGAQSWSSCSCHPLHYRSSQEATATSVGGNGLLTSGMSFWRQIELLKRQDPTRSCHQHCRSQDLVFFSHGLAPCQSVLVSCASRSVLSLCDHQMCLSFSNGRDLANFLLSFWGSLRHGSSSLRSVRHRKSTKMSYSSCWASRLCGAYRFFQCHANVFWILRIQICPLWRQIQFPSLFYFRILL